jgi:transposase InsO family protein
MIQSMPRKGNRLDNAIIENYLRALKSEMFYRQKFKSTEQLNQIQTK